ncbi:MAG: hypothetical protein JXA94_02215 [Parachlamydiales bacterium]|nr:hypothetical protein [Parachlamydiales bacterium]
MNSNNPYQLAKILADKLKNLKNEGEEVSLLEDSFITSLLTLFFDQDLIKSGLNVEKLLKMAILKNIAKCIENDDKDLSDKKIVKRFFLENFEEDIAYPIISLYKEIYKNETPEANYISNSLEFLNSDIEEEISQEEEESGDDEVSSEDDACCEEEEELDPKEKLQLIFEYVTHLADELKIDLKGKKDKEGKKHKEDKKHKKYKCKKHF